MNEGRYHKQIKIVIFLIAVAVFLMAAKLFNVNQILREALTRINDLGTLGVAAYIIIYILACVFFVPGSVLTLGAGVIYGVIHGSAIVSAASTLGATSAFLVGRYLARDWIAKKIEGNEKFMAIDRAVGTEGWKIVGLTRLSPVFPFNLLNYAFGLTQVSWKDYLLASWIGMMPGTVMYVYIGSLAGDLASLGRERSARTQAEWILYAVGFIATVAVTLYVTRIAKKVLTQKIS